MTGHTLATGRAATLIKLIFSAGAKISAALASFVVTALVTRNMSNHDAGLFLLGFTLLFVLSIFFRLGLDNVILRFLSAHGTDAFAQEKLNRGLLWIATAVIPATLLGMALSEQIATNVFNKPEFEPVLFWMLPALPAMSIFFLLSFAFQAQHRVVVTTIFQTLGISTLFIVGFGYLWFNQADAISAAISAQLYSVVAAIVLFVAITTWFSQKKVNFKLTGYLDAELSHASMNLWMASIMGLAVQWSGILIAGAMLPAEDVALLTAAQRTAMLTSFILMIVNMVVAPRYAKMWKNGETQRIRRLAKLSARGMIAMVLPIVMMMMLWSEEIMSLFGEGFSQAGMLLMILTIGQLVNVVTGSGAVLLGMSGHEREFNVVSMVTGAISIFLAAILTKLFDVEGTAVATTIGVCLLNIGTALMVKRKLGFTVLG